MGFISGLLLASIVPLIFLVIVRKLDFYQTGQFWLVLLSLVAGMIAYVPASFTNNLFMNVWSIEWSNIQRYVAPVAEEIFKGLILLYLIRLPQFTFSMDGAVYGFAAGIGFAIVENYEYISQEPSLALVIALQRIFSANLVHGSSSAVLGIALGIFHIRRFRWRWLILASGLFTSIGQHIFYNNISNDGMSVLRAAGIGVLGAVFIYLAMHHGKRQAQNWIRHKLGMDERITGGEVAAVDCLARDSDVLLPVYERFGPEKAGQVEKLLYLQARLGMKIRALDSFPRESSLYRAVESEISAMRIEVELVRRSIGVYPMLFVRGLFTEEMVSVWERMQAKIQERSALNGDEKEGNVWASLDERLKTKVDVEKPG